MTKLFSSHLGKRCGELLKVSITDIIKSLGETVPPQIRVGDLPYVMNPVPGSSTKFTVSCSCPIADLSAREVGICALVLLNTTTLPFTSLPFDFVVPFLPFTTATSPTITCNAACTSCQVDIPSGYQNYVNLFGTSTNSTGPVAGVVCAELIVSDIPSVLGSIL